MSLHVPVDIVSRAPGQHGLQNLVWYRRAYNELGWIRNYLHDSNKYARVDNVASDVTPFPIGYPSMDVTSKRLGMLHLPGIYQHLPEILRILRF